MLVLGTLASSTALLAGCGRGGHEEAAWPLPNHDLASSRSSPQSGVDRGNVSRLHVLWRFRLRIKPRESGDFTATPIVSGGTVYAQDMESNVFALDGSTGALVWKHMFGDGNPGPNGIAVVGNRILGATDTTAFALSKQSGRLLWQRRLVSVHEQYVDTAPQAANGLVYWSTIGYPPGGRGALYALDIRTGAIRWKRSTIKEPWRYPHEAGGGGAWYPPSVADDGTVYWGTANPDPWGGTVARPNGGSFPGPVLYTDSLVALDGQTGGVRWYDQVTPHDIRDHDFQLSPILGSAGDVPAVFGAGKAGVVVAWNRRTHRRIWQRRVGKHENDRGPLPSRYVPVCPGLLGGVETPMAQADDRLFVPIVNLCMLGSSHGYKPLATADVSAGRGAFVAIDTTSGHIAWRRALPQPDFGCATVADGVVFTSTLDGELYALDTRDGTTLWQTRMRAGVNSCPAVADHMLVVAAGVPRGARHQSLELVAYGIG